MLPMGRPVCGRDKRIDGRLLKTIANHLMPFPQVLSLAYSGLGGNDVIKARCP